MDDDVDHGAHGRFDSRSSDSSNQIALDLNRDWIIGGIVGLAAVLVGGALRSKRGRESVREWKRAA